MWSVLEGSLSCVRGLFGGGVTAVIPLLLYYKLSVLAALLLLGNAHFINYLSTFILSIQYLPGAALNAGEEISVNIDNVNHLSLRASPVLVCRDQAVDHRNLLHRSFSTPHMAYDFLSEHRQPWLDAKETGFEKTESESLPKKGE